MTAMTAAPPASAVANAAAHSGDPDDYCHYVTADGRLLCTGSPITPGQQARLHSANTNCGRPRCPRCAEVSS